MSDTEIIAVLSRLSTKPCSLTELEDLVSMDRRKEEDWVSNFVAHPLVTLVRWGVVDANQGFLRLTPDELAHVSFDARVWDIEFSMSPVAAEIEQALGLRIWSPESRNSSG